MNKFQKLAQLNRDIELLENAGKIKAADILHQKFVRIAQNAITFIPPAYPVKTPVPMAAPTAGARPKTTPVLTTGTPLPSVSPADKVKRYNFFNDKLIKGYEIQDPNKRQQFIDNMKKQIESNEELLDKIQYDYLMRMINGN